MNRRHIVLQVLVQAAFAIGLQGLPAQSQPESGGRISIGAKTFTESNILAEIVAQLLEARTDLDVDRRFNLGGTMICHGAMVAGKLDGYCEYTGTAWSILLKEPGPAPDPLRTYFHVARRSAEEFGITWLAPFGLDNTYRIAVREDLAERLGLQTMSDLAAAAADLRAGFSVEFLEREDGWPGLQRTYGFEFQSVRGLEHGLAYQGIADRQLDVIDAYATDGKLQRYPLRLLEDDRDFFPPYQAAPLFRSEILEQHPEIRTALQGLALRLPDAEMQRLNLLVEQEGWSEARAARQFLDEVGLVRTEAPARDEGEITPRDERSFFAVLNARWAETARLTGEHLQLTLLAVLLALLVAVPLGILATRNRLFGQVALGVAGVLQTVPSLAMLAFMIPLPGFGLSPVSAIAALFLYAILPILRNTYTAIRGVDPQLIDAARGLGFREREILWRVQLPLSIRMILAGLRTATVIGIGVATLGAFIGAGGLGEPITRGIYLNDTNLVLAGAVPAAVLALLADFGLGALERKLAPRGT